MRPHGAPRYEAVSADRSPPPRLGARGRWSARLPRLPDWVLRYEVGWLVRDASCALTLGFVLVAQSLAHAALCGVGAIRGPYACTLPPLLYALLGTCHEASVGTGGLVALLTGERLRALYPGSEGEARRTAAVATLSALVGLLLTAMAVLRLGFLVRFLSRPALSGFITASALLIGRAMAGDMLTNEPASAAAVLEFELGLAAAGRGAGTGAGEAPTLHAPTVAVSLCALAWLALAGRAAPNGPRVAALLRFKELVALAAGTAAAAASGNRLGLATVGDVPEGLPALAFPALDGALARSLFPDACLVAVVVFVSSFASAKKCALAGGYAVVASRELWALGAANVASALVGGVPVQVGLSRSALSRALGAKSQLGAGVLPAALVAAVVGFAAPAVRNAPRCVLAAIITAAASKLIEADLAMTLWRLRAAGGLKDFVVWVAAFFWTLAFGAFHGVLLAVALSLALVLHSVASPNLVALARRDPDGAWVSAPSLGGGAAPAAATTLVVRVEGPLWYANAERFHEQLDDLELRCSARGEAPLAIVLLASSTSFVDATAVAVLEEMCASWALRRVHFYVADAYGAARQLLEAALGETHPRLADCSRSVDACVADELAYRRLSPRGRAPSLDGAGDAPAAPAADDPAARGLRVGFARSLPSFTSLAEA